MWLVFAGASTVQLTSALYTHGSEIISQILTCIEEWMHQSRIKTIEEFRGKLNYKIVVIRLATNVLSLWSTFQTAINTGD